MVEPLFNQINAAQHHQRRAKWAHAYENLVAWLEHESLNSDYHHSYSTRQGQETPTDGILSNEALNHISHPFNQWSTTLLRRAREASSAYPAINEAMWLYHYYCRWLQQTLAEFDRILHEEPLRTTSSYQHYREHRALFGEMAEWLHREQLSLILSTLYGDNRAQIEPLLVDLETSTAEMASIWRETVLAAASSAQSDMHTLAPDQARD